MADDRLRDRTRAVAADPNDYGRLLELRAELERKGVDRWLLAGVLVHDEWEQVDLAALSRRLALRAGMCHIQAPLFDAAGRIVGGIAGLALCGARSKPESEEHPEGVGVSFGGRAVANCVECLRLDGRCVCGVYHDHNELGCPTAVRENIHRGIALVDDLIRQAQALDDPDPPPAPEVRRSPVRAPATCSVCQHSINDAVPGFERWRGDTYLDCLHYACVEGARAEAADTIVPRGPEGVGASSSARPTRACMFCDETVTDLSGAPVVHMNGHLVGYRHGPHHPCGQRVAAQERQRPGG